MQAAVETVLRNELFVRAARFQAARTQAAIDARTRTLRERILHFWTGRAVPAFRRLTFRQRLALQFIVTFVVAFLLLYTLAGTLTD